MAGKTNFPKGQTPLEIANPLKRRKFLTGPPARQTRLTVGQAEVGLAFSRAGQSIAEYAIIVGIIISAIIAMQVYVQRGLQARYKAFTDSLTSSIHSPTQYEPYYTRSEFDVQQNAQLWERQWGKASVRRSSSAGSESSGVRSTEPGCLEGAEGCPAYCGNGVCDAGETCATCWSDCPFGWRSGTPCTPAKANLCCSRSCSAFTLEGVRVCN